MIDQIERLEQRIERLVQGLDQSRQRNAELERENDRLASQIESLNQVKAHNDALNEQVHRLEEEIEAMTGKESQIRERLNQMLQKIDSIEQEVKAGGC
ncbi:hypothetical protein LLG95_14650 [bacterium]|nr:hypothetical protein [bacterium]